MTTRPYLRDRAFVFAWIAGVMWVQGWLALETTCGADAWIKTGEGRVQKLAIEAEGRAGFTRLDGVAVGISFTNRLSLERAITNQIFLNGSGVAAGDVDGDGLCDLYFSGLESGNVLYRNRGGWRFEDVTRAAGVACEGQASTGCVLADVDGDGDLDLLVNGIASGTRLFLNDGRGRFGEVTDGAGLRSKHGGTSMALADVDGDGDLDLYVVNYRNDTMRDMPELRFEVRVTNGVYQLMQVNGRRAEGEEWEGRFSFDKTSGVLENGEPDQLYRNLGGGRFEAVPWKGGTFLDEEGRAVAVPYDWGLSAQFHDLNGDGAPDLYVCNDFHSPDRIWMNDGRGRFKAIAGNAIRQTSLFSMGVDVADVNRDGRVDVFVADMLSPDHLRRQVQVMDAMAFAQYRSVQLDRPQTARNTLLLNRGAGLFSEVASMWGVEASDWSWCPAFVDVDLDGYEDLLITTGHARDAQNADTIREMEQVKARGGMNPQEERGLRRMFAPLLTPNVAFRNQGGNRFENLSKEWGFDATEISHGLALADLDGDGDLDVVVSTLNAGPLIYRNESVQPRIAIRLAGRAPNTAGVGARIRVVAHPDSGLPVQTQEIIAGGRYLSGDAAERAFATASATLPVRVEVRWRSGLSSVLSNATPNHRYEVHEPMANRDYRVAVMDEVPPIAMFADLSDRLQHQHEDSSIQDPVLQPLIPHSPRWKGPSVAWFDFNGDGWEDLFIAGGRGGKMGVFRNDGKGGFIRQRSKLFEQSLAQGQVHVQGWMPARQERGLVLVSEAISGANAMAAVVRTVSLVDASEQRVELPAGFNPGPVVVDDFDGDGDPDVFVGGGALEGRFPKASTSVLLRNDRGRLVLDAERSQAFEGLGPVQGATFAKLAAGSGADLVLACEWGPIRIFNNRDGFWVSWDPEVVDSQDSARSSRPLSWWTGWWTAVAAGDFDGDGRMDLVVGNWGKNHRRQRFLGQPIEMYFGDSDGSGNGRIFESVYDVTLGKRVPLQDLAALRSTFPMLQDRYASMAEFARAGTTEILGEAMAGMGRVEARDMASVILLNRGNRLERVELPWEVQIAPVQGFAVGDVNGDGRLDVLVTQNVFEVGLGEGRLDAGRGLILLGDGKGKFKALSGEESGVDWVGEGRGIALGDFDRDGRLDFVVGQYRGGTRLFGNRFGVRKAGVK